MASHKKKEANISKELGSLKGERQRLNTLLIQTADKVKKGEALLSELEKRLRKLSRKENKIRTEIGKRHGKIAKMLGVMQRMGRQPPPIMATHRDDALKMVRSAMLLASVFPQLKTEADRMAADLTSLVQIVTLTKTRAIELRKQTKQLTLERKTVKQLLSQKKNNILARQQELKAVQQAVRSYASNARNLSDLIAKTDKEVSRKTVLGKYKKELAQGKTGIKSTIDPKTGKKINLIPGNKRVDTVSLSPSRIKPAISFVRTKGLLPLPASGTRLKSFGGKSKYGSASKGILLATRNEAQVTSPSDGWVVYSGPFRSYGQLLIINAGGGYHILLAGMKKIEVTTGQFVLAGEPVALMGTSKLTSTKTDEYLGQKLYIEFRKNGRPIDPDPWWSNGQRKAQG